MMLEYQKHRTRIIMLKKTTRVCRVIIYLLFNNFFFRKFIEVCI